MRVTFWGRVMAPFLDPRRLWSFSSGWILHWLQRRWDDRPWWSTWTRHRLSVRPAGWWEPLWNIQQGWWEQAILGLWEIVAAASLSWRASPTTQPSNLNCHKSWLAINTSSQPKSWDLRRPCPRTSTFTSSSPLGTIMPACEDTYPFWASHWGMLWGSAMSFCC